MEIKPKIQGQNSPFPGCCGATILNGLYISMTASQHAPKTESAQFATTVESQSAEIAALEAVKFVPLATWTNKNTAHEVTLWGKGVEKV